MPYKLITQYKYITANISLTICFFLIFIINTGMIQKSTSSDFEGTINLTKQTLYDTTFYSFIVKNNLVRIDEKTNKNNIIQSIIIDVSSKSITALSPSQKLYTNIYKNRIYPYNDVKITKTEEFKYINGFKCTLWRVKNFNFNTEVSLWLSYTNFNFFSQVTELLSKTEDYSQLCSYFNLIPQNSGYFPILIVERTLLREEKSRMLVTSVQHHIVNSNLFKIPRDYRCLVN